MEGPNVEHVEVMHELLAVGSRGKYEGREAMQRGMIRQDGGGGKRGEEDDKEANMNVSLVGTVKLSFWDADQTEEKDGAKRRQRARKVSEEDCDGVTEAGRAGEEDELHYFTSISVANSDIMNLVTYTTRPNHVNGRGTSRR